MILEAVFKEEEAMNADFGVLSKGDKGDKGDPGVVDYSLVANALKGSASGNPIRLDDVSPLEHEIVVHCEGWSSNPLLENMVGGIDDLIDMDADSGKVLFVESCTVSEPNEEEDASFRVVFTDGSYASFIGNPTTQINQGMAMCVDGQVLYYAENKANGATIEKYGKNLFVSLANPTYSGNKITMQRSADGSWTINGIAADQCVKALKSARVLPCGDYVLSINADKPQEGVQVFIANEPYYSFYVATYENPVKFKITKEEKLSFFINIPKGAVCENVVIRPQLEVGSQFTGFEKGVLETLTADENGNVSIIGNGETVTLMAESGVTISAEYNRDINKAFAEINQKLTALSAVLINNV